jgi:ABC-type multidrug transport system fused ATPase/permease subunit
MAGVAESVPQLIARERDYLRGMITDERVATMQQLQAMQAATMDDLKSMQSDTMQQLDHQRIAVTRDVQQERVAVLNQLEKERMATTREIREFGHEMFTRLDRSADEKIDSITSRGIRITDHFFWRTMQLGIATLLVLLILTWCIQQRRTRHTVLPAARDDWPWQEPSPRTGDGPGSATEHQRAA